ncbi:MAG: hypothetical protein JSW65_06210, partial [Candidatus Bipolaricaulota bacterium]
RWGRGKYFMGSAWYYVIAASIFRMSQRPWIVGGVAIMLGYLGAALRRHRRYDDPQYLRFLRRYELRSLLFGKRRTLERYAERIRSRSDRLPGRATQAPEAS